MLNAASKRASVRDSYGSWKWKVRVDSMSDTEIDTMYDKLVKSNTIKIERTHDNCRYKPGGVDVCTRSGSSNFLTPGSAACSRWRGRRK